MTSWARVLRRYNPILVWVLAIAFNSTGANAGIGGIPTLDDLLANFGSLKTETVRSVGLLISHHPYQPATPLGLQMGLDFGIELTLMSAPDGFLESLKENGLQGTLPSTTLPMAKLHLHKGISPNSDIGFSYIGYQMLKVYGADLQWAFYQPEEGPTWAARLCFTQGSLSYVKATVWNPQILISKKLSFADPYLGFGYSWIFGSIKGSQTVTDAGTGLSVKIPIEVSGLRANGASAFIGLPLRLPLIGVKVTLEGAYSLDGANSLGAKIGMQW